MWNCESKKFDSKNINKFKDLKIFDTLEPKKVETFDKNNVTTALLVDISDSDNSDPNVVGSFLDVKKKEFDLIDLFENLYVTPQHVANKNDLEQNLFDLDHTDTSKTYNDNEGSSKEIRPFSEKEDTLKENRRKFDEIFDSASKFTYNDNGRSAKEIRPFSEKEDTLKENRRKFDEIFDSASKLTYNDNGRSAKEIRPFSEKEDTFKENRKTFAEIFDSASKLTYNDNGRSAKEIRPFSEKEDTLKENRRKFDEIFDSASKLTYNDNGRSAKEIRPFSEKEDTFKENRKTFAEIFDSASKLTYNDNGRSAKEIRPFSEKEDTFKENRKTFAEIFDSASKLTYNDNGRSAKEIRPFSEKEDTFKENRRTFDEIFDSAVSSRYSILEFKSENPKSEDTVDGLTIERQTHLYSRPFKDLTPPISNFNIEPPEVNTSNLTALYRDDNFNFEPNINKINNPLSKEKTLTIEVPHGKLNKQCDEDIKILRPPFYNNISNPSSGRTNNLTALSKDIFTIKRNDQSTHNNKKDCDVQVLDKSNHIFNYELSKVRTNNMCPIYEAEKPAEDTFVDIFKVPKVELNYLKQNEKTAKRNIFESDPITRYRKQITSSLVDLNKPPIVLTINTQIPVLQTAKKDTKAFNKRRIVKKDIEKIGFTKGPDIYEKSVVLPQIIQRLGERNKCLDARNNVRRKLVLDKGTNNNIVIPKLSPEVLMEDCNKERLKALKLRTAFEKFVMSGHF